MSNLSGNMSNERYDFLSDINNKDNPACRLTKEELESGWHYCNTSFDGMLIHNTWDEYEYCCCDGICSSKNQERLRMNELLRMEYGLTIANLKIEINTLKIERAEIIAAGRELAEKPYSPMAALRWHKAIGDFPKDGEPPTSAGPWTWGEKK